MADLSIKGVGGSGLELITSTAQALDVNNVNALVPLAYDYIGLGYTGPDLTTVVYKVGGAGGTTVATLTLTYLASVLQTVTRS